jgi:methionyl-tRNA formyltransferase
MVRVVFWGSSDGVFSNRHYAALVTSGCRIAAVVDVPAARRSTTNAARLDGRSFLQHARENGIPIHEPEKPNAPDFVETMRALDPDLFVAVGYMLLLKEPLLSVPRIAAANFHASLLPAYRGKHPVFWALRAGETWCGLTVHQMNAGLDTGDIMFQVRVPVRDGDSVAALYDRIMAESVPLAARLVSAAAGGNIPRTPQPQEGASYFGATNDADFRLDWRMDAATIVRWIKATPGKCWVAAGGEKLFAGDARVLSDRTTGAERRPGCVLRAGADGCEVQAGSGVVLVQGLRGPGLAAGAMLETREKNGGR